MKRVNFSNIRELLKIYLFIKIIYFENMPKLSVFAKDISFEVL